MSEPVRPRIRPLELVPMEEGDDSTFALRDPSGFSAAASLPMGAAMLVTLMNGERTFGELQTAFAEKTGQQISLADVEEIVKQLDDRIFLDNERFAQHKVAIVEAYDELEVRPAAHAGGAYEGEFEALQIQLAKMFTDKEGPGLLPWEGKVESASETVDKTDKSRLCGIMSPHIDFHRGGPAFAWAYDRIVTESDAEVFVILGTAHTALEGMYSVSRKHFETPLGTAKADYEFIDALQNEFVKRSGQSAADIVFHDEMPHRGEHSIEFQALMLQYVLGGRRDYTIVPVLVGSFHEFIEKNDSPEDSPAVMDFAHALRETVANCGKKVCYIAGVDMAHIGQQFGDEELLDDARLKYQWASDQSLLTAACEGDVDAWFIHVAAVQDRNRICGLAPTYTMLQAMQPTRGEILKYDQAVEEDRTSCVSYAAVAFYE